MLSCRRSTGSAFVAVTLATLASATEIGLEPTLLQTRLCLSLVLQPQNDGVTARSVDVHHPARRPDRPLRTDLLQVVPCPPHDPARRRDPRHCRLRACVSLPYHVPGLYAFLHAARKARPGHLRAELGPVAPGPSRKSGAVQVPAPLPQLCPHPRRHRPLRPRRVASRARFRGVALEAADVDPLPHLRLGRPTFPPVRRWLRPPAPRATTGPTSRWLPAAAQRLGSLHRHRGALDSREGGERLKGGPHFAKHTSKPRAVHLTPYIFHASFPFSLLYQQHELVLTNNTRQASSDRNPKLEAKGRHTYSAGTFHSFDF